MKQVAGYKTIYASQLQTINSVTLLGAPFCLNLKLTTSEPPTLCLHAKRASQGIFLNVRNSIIFQIDIK